MIDCTDRFPKITTQCLYFNSTQMHVPSPLFTNCENFPDVDYFKFFLKSLHSMLLHICLIQGEGMKADTYILKFIFAYCLKH